MKRLLLGIVSVAALSAFGQSGLEPSKSGKTSGGTFGKSVTILAQPGGVAHQLDLPDFFYRNGDQAGCPVQILDAAFHRPAEMVLTAARTYNDAGPTLHLNYRNLSGKDIEVVTVTGWIKTKDSPYQLDYVTRPFTLELSRKALLGKDVEAKQALHLASNAYGLDRIELSKVTYTDGTVDMPKPQSCVFHANADLERAKAW